MSDVKSLPQDKLVSELLRRHQMWLYNNTTGVRLNLAGANMEGAYMSGANLSSTTVEDPWKHRSEGMRCATCMWYVEKEEGKGRCRRHAPTMNGYPVVYPTDWCGDHKVK